MSSGLPGLLDDAPGQLPLPLEGVWHLPIRCLLRQVHCQSQTPFPADCPNPLPAAGNHVVLIAVSGGGPCRPAAQQPEHPHRVPSHQRVSGISQVSSRAVSVRVLVALGCIRAQLCCGETLSLLRDKCSFVGSGRRTACSPSALCMVGRHEVLGLRRQAIRHSSPCSSGSQAGMGLWVHRRETTLLCRCWTCQPSCLCSSTAQAGPLQAIPATTGDLMLLFQSPSTTARCNGSPLLRAEQFC